MGQIRIGWLVDKKERWERPITYGGFIDYRFEELGRILQDRDGAKVRSRQWSTFLSCRGWGKSCKED